MELHGFKINEDSIVILISFWKLYKI